MISTKLEEYLESEEVPYTRHPHAVAYTSQEVAHFAHIPGRELLKSVILKTGDGQLVMAVLSSNQAVNLDGLRQEIGCSGLRLATEEEFRDAFPTCQVGAMPPVGSLFGVRTYCDADLATNSEIEFNAGAHDETVRMTFRDFRRLGEPELVRLAEPFHRRPQRRAA